MKIQTALNHQKRATLAIAAMYASAKTYHPTQDKMLEQRREILDSLAHCPTWVTQYVRGYDQALSDNLRQDLEFCSLLYGGKLVSHHRTSSRYYEKQGYSAKEVCVGKIAKFTGFFWKDTGHPFTITRAQH